MRFWINTIYVHRNDENKWAAMLTWNSVQDNDLRKKQGYIRGDFLGKIETQYFEETLTKSIDMVLNVAKYMNIDIVEDFKPHVLYTEDEELLKEFPFNEDDLIATKNENIARGWGAIK